jgi:hypothetical protein
MKVNKDNFLDFTLEDVEGAVTAIEYGFDAEAAQNLIHYFHYMLRDGCFFECVQLRPKEQAFVNYVAHAFERITEEKSSADIAFGLKLARGKYIRPDTTERDFTAVAYMILLIRNGKTWNEAKGEAANLFSPDGGDKAMEEAYRKYSKIFGIIPDETLTKMLPEGTPVIKRNMTG